MHRAAVYGGVNLIGSTGLAGRGGVIPAAIGTLTVEELASIYVRELTEAVPGTDVRAGTIVLGPEEGSDELAAHLALASSLAHAETSAPIVVLGGPLATIQARRVLARGADPEHVLVCGVDTGQLSFDELDELAGMGVRIGFTQIGKEFALADEARASLIAYSLRRYGTDRVCFGTGSWARWLGPGEPEGAHRPGGTILMEFIDRLATYGVGADTVNEVLTSGVRSLFTSQAAV
jgi:predicted metal-dependent phosphotriesterase family hydrolase